MTDIFTAIYLYAGIAVVVYLLVLATRFVRAHERIARALELTGQNQK